MHFEHPQSKGWALLGIALLLGLMLLPGSARPAAAKSGVEVTNVRVEYVFGKQIRFLGQFQSSIPIQTATVTFRAGDGYSQTQPLAVDANGSASYQYDASLNAIPPFSKIVFWFDFALADGTAFTSPMYDFTYTDNRFSWQEHTEGALRVHWYAGDAAFGAAAFDASQRGLDSVRRLFPVEDAGPIDIYIYANVNDLQSALSLGGQVWVAGHASPALGVVMVSIPPQPDPSIALERQVPHELTHILLYQRIGADYERLPVWLTEGLATLAELYPDPDLDAALTQAVEADTLLPLADLCAAFPLDTGRAFLAYAESESFARFLLDNYGMTGLSALISAYADGMDCEQGARQALDQPLSQLEARWRESALGEDRGRVVAMNLSPYLIILGLVLILPAWSALRFLLERRKHDRPFFS